MFETLKNALKVKEIRMKLLWTVLLLVVFRLGCIIPIPGLKRDIFSEAFEGNDFLQIMSAITGNALSNGTLFALGIGPYINASIIVQLLCFGIPALERLSKEGEDGRKKIAQLTRYVAIGLAVIQSVGIIVNFAVQGNGSESAINTNLFGGELFGPEAATWIAGVYMTVVYTAGACLVMWLGDRMTEYGIGNGMSMIIFIGIICSAGQALIKTFGRMPGLFSGSVPDAEAAFWELIGFVIVTVFLFAAIVTVDLAERKIPVQYAKQVKGRKQYGGQRSEIPMRIAASGVMPLIFAFAIISVPSMIISIFFPDQTPENNWWLWIQSGDGQWIYSILLTVLIFAFAFFYAQIQFNPDDVAKSIQQNGGFIQGIRPGRPTAEFLKKISGRITLFGAIYLSLVAFVPSLIFSLATNGNSDLVSVFSTTGILIVVSVAMEFDKQLQAQLMMKNYKGFLK